MKKIEITVGLGLVGCRRVWIIEVDDDLPDDEIEELAREAMLEQMEWSWERVESKKGDA